MIIPDVQYAHCIASSFRNASCTGCNFPSFSNDSIVVTFRCPISPTVNRQDRRGAPSSNTVHAPHSPSPHPYFAPVKSRSSRNTLSKLRSPSTSIRTAFPLTKSSLILAMVNSCFQDGFYPATVTTIFKNGKNKRSEFDRLARLRTHGLSRIITEGKWRREMPISSDQQTELGRFLDSHDFAKGCLALDLDGTALNEERGRIYIPESVEAGVKAIHDLKRPVVINTLRFPLSVINTIGLAWYQLADIPILTVLLNGSILGNIQLVNGALEYEEIAAFPMTAHEIKTVLDGVSQLLKDSVDEILLFYYPRNWREGETLWTPKPERMDGLKQKFVSAAIVKSTSLDELAVELSSKDICMMSLFIDRPEDTLMAYQHAKRNSFFTRRGVDKAYGLREMAKRLNISLADSVAAGDTEMDTFLNETGLSVIVGRAALPFKGKSSTVRVANPPELGHFLCALAEHCKVHA